MKFTNTNQAPEQTLYKTPFMNYLIWTDTEKFMFQNGFSFFTDL